MKVYITTWTSAKINSFGIWTKCIIIYNFYLIFLWYTHSTDQEMDRLMIITWWDTYSVTQKLDFMDAYPFLRVTIVVSIFYYSTAVSFVNLKNS